MKPRHVSSPGEIAGILVGSSPAARELRDELALASRVPVRVMIAGEHGVGKKRLARLIHRQSLRSRAPFIRVRCTEPEAELDACLFGRRRSAPGALERADGGTVFLQDVDGLPQAAQSRLMRFIATGSVQPIDPKGLDRPTNARVICATTVSLSDTLGADTFSEELYYRLNTIYLPIPPLRERVEDVEPLLEYFTAYYARRAGVAIPRLTSECLATCCADEWPGNMRQLQAVASMLVARTSPGSPASILESAARACLEQQTRDRATLRV